MRLFAEVPDLKASAPFGYGQDTYRIDFQVPAEAATGTAAMQLSAAWIPGVPVSLMVQ